MQYARWRAARLATLRQHAVNFALHVARTCACTPLEVMSADIGVGMIRAYLRERDEACVLRQQVTNARKADRIGTDSGNSKNDDSDVNGAASAALSALDSLRAKAKLSWDTEHPTLEQFRGRPPARENGGAVDPEALLTLHFELLAQDTTQKPMVRDAASLAALESNLCLRGALARIPASNSTCAR